MKTHRLLQYLTWENILQSFSYNIDEKKFKKELFLQKREKVQIETYNYIVAI